MPRTMPRQMSYADMIANAESNVDKLPKWAQSYIVYLQRQAEGAKRELEEIKNPPGDSDVFVERLGMRSDDHPVGKGSRIRFKLPGRKYNDSISVAVRGEYLEINGDDSIVIEPQSGNHVRIKIREW